MKTSVIIPTYNRAELVTQAVDSVLAQSTDDDELLVVIDGSTDNTAQSLQRYGDRIHVIHQPNSGVNSARNRALAESSGEYVALLDDDDLWYPFKLRLQIQLMERFPDLAYIFTNFSIYREGEPLRTNGIQTWFRNPHEWQNVFDSSMTLEEAGVESAADLPDSTRLYVGCIHRPSLTQYYVLPSTALIRRDMIADCLRFNEQDPVCGDWEFFARLSRDSLVGYLDYDTVYNRSHEDATRLTRTSWKKQLEYRVAMIDRLYLDDADFCQRYGGEVYREYCRTIRALWRQYLLDNDRQALFSSLRKYRERTSVFSLPSMLFTLANCVPGTGRVLRGIRAVRG